ncbi:MAG: type II secretion system F family protein [Candidatus Taylorbacteria bacterium]|nr:type II secretion system F family protein [Candidatus Taylorbacteria bacterium]
MAKFKYKIKTKSGNVEEGEREVPDKFALYKEFRANGSEIISIVDSSEHKFKNINIPLPGFLTGIKAHEKIIFARNLGSMLEAGLALSRALNVIIRQSKNKRMTTVLNAVNDDISKGKTFSDALNAYPNIFSSLFVSMVKAGEESGSLAESLKTVALQLDRSYTLQRKIKGAMVYPCVILVLMVVIALIMLMYIVPTITSTFKDMNIDLPASTKVIIGMSDLIRFHYIIVFGGIMALLAGFYSFARTKNGKRTFDYTIIHMPLISDMVKEVNAARTARTLASLLSAGVDVVESLRITEEVIQNSFYKDIVKSATDEVQKGSPMSSIFLRNEKLYPVFVGEMMSVGEETGKMGEMLRNVAQFYEDEVEQKTKDMSSIIEPVLMVIIGIAVGFFAISMIMPMYSLADKL